MVMIDGGMLATGLELDSAAGRHREGEAQVRVEADRPAVAQDGSEERLLCGDRCGAVGDLPSGVRVTLYQRFW